MAVPMFPMYNNSKAAIASGPCFYQMVSFDIRFYLASETAFIRLVYLTTLYLIHLLREL
jgi:hypothetical protein